MPFQSKKIIFEEGKINFFNIKLILVYFYILSCKNIATLSQYNNYNYKINMITYVSLYFRRQVIRIRVRKAAKSSFTNGHVIKTLPPPPSQA